MQSEIKIRIRQENDKDRVAVHGLIERAFATEEFSDQKEHLMVERLRGTEAFIPELSLVAECGDKLVGHILLTRIRILQGSKVTESLALAPVSVLPGFQRKGIGSLLIKEAHQRARKMGYGSVIVLGHENYYPRFGYQRAELYGIEFPFDAPAANCMAIELKKNSLKAAGGKVAYPPEFYE